MRSLQQTDSDPTYLEFFGLTRPPFARLADPAQLFHTEQYELLAEYLTEATANADSLVVLCGADGSGKSTLLSTYMSSIGERASCVVINETCKDEIQFYTAFLKQIGFDQITGTLNELRNITKEFLVCRGIAGDHALILFDNAHQTDPRILNQLRWLCDIKIKDCRVLSVVLSGNAGLVRVVDAPAMRSIKFRSHVVFSIRAFTEEETANYIWHRLRMAGGDAGVRLPQESYACIHRYSGGIPNLINDLCHATLAEAQARDTRVIDEKLVRIVANDQQLLPHVIPFHGKGRRRTDPDFHRLQAVPDAGNSATAGRSQTNESHEAAAQATPHLDPENLQRQIAQLSSQVEDLRADKKRAIQDIEARNKDITELREELGSQTRVAQDLKRSLVQAAENELATNESSVIHAQRTQEMQSTIDNLQSEFEAGRKVADERAVAIETLKKNTAELQHELGEGAGKLDSLRDELDSRNEEFIDLEKRLEESQKECELAELRIVELKSPEELQEIKAATDELAADLEKERNARESAVIELAEATTTVEELSQLKQTLSATIGRLENELKVASERAAESDALEKKSADLKDELERKSGDSKALKIELDSLSDELSSKNQELAELEKRLEESQKEHELAERRILSLHDPEELQKITKTSDRHEADLREQTRARETAEAELATAAAAVDELSQLKQEQRSTIDDLEAELKSAQEHAAAFDILEKKSTEQKAELENKANDLALLQDELKLRNEILADLEIRFEQSQSACELAQQRIVELKSPKELEEIDKTFEELAADLEKERDQRESLENELAEATAAVDGLGQLKQEHQVKLESLQADIEAGLKVADERAAEIDSLQKSTADLEGELGSKTGELDSLRQELDSRSKELEEVRRTADELAAGLDDERCARESTVVELAEATASVDELSQLKSDLQATVASLQADIDAGHKVADERAAEIESRNVELDSLRDELKLRNEILADLEKERDARESLENELAEATAAVDGLGQLKQDHKETIESLQADIEAGLKVAEDRAAEIEALQTSTAGLEADIENKAGELVAKSGVIADLETQLEESRVENQSAHVRIAALKDPEELEDIEKASDQLAADLEKERLAREAAENELAGATATIGELSELKQELQAKIDSLQADIEAGFKVADGRAAEIEALETKAARLNAEIETRDVENDSLQDQLSSTSQHVADLEKEHHARDEAENELAEAKATIDELQQQQTELRETILELNVDLRLAGENAVSIYSLERNVSDLKDELEKSAHQLESRNQAVEELEEQLAASRKVNEMLQSRAPVASIGAATGPKSDTPEKRIEPSAVAKKFEKSAEEVPAYGLLREYDPEFYGDLVSRYESLVAQGLTDKQVSDVLRSKQAEFMERLLPRASNGTILDYARLIVEQLDEFQLDRVEPCLKLLVPPSDPEEDSSPDYSEHHKGREFALLEKTLRTYRATRRLPSEEDVWPDLELIFAGLFHAFGADNVAAMQNSYDPSIDRVLVCNVTRALYSGILDLPKGSATNALRWLLST